MLKVGMNQFMSNRALPSARPPGPLSRESRLSCYSSASGDATPGLPGFSGRFEVPSCYLGVVARQPLNVRVQEKGDLS